MEVCRLCSTPLAPGAARCPVCGLHQARGLTRSSWWRVAAGLAGVYGVVALVLVLTR